jgi:hypothetical protein
VAEPRVEAGVLRDEAQKMALAKHEDMVEQFAPKSADKALGEGVHVRGPDRGANDLSADLSLAKTRSDIVDHRVIRGTRNRWPCWM